MSFQVFFGFLLAIITAFLTFSLREVSLEKKFITIKPKTSSRKSVSFRLIHSSLQDHCTGWSVYWLFPYFLRPSIHPSIHQSLQSPTMAGWGRTNERTDGQTYAQMSPVFYITSSPIGPLPCQHPNCHCKVDGQGKGISGLLAIGSFPFFSSFPLFGEGFSTFLHAPLIPDGEQTDLTQ